VELTERPIQKVGNTEDKPEADPKEISWNELDLQNSIQYADYYVVSMGSNTIELINYGASVYYNLTCFQKSTYYSGTKIFNNLPSSLKSLMNEKAPI
jgi:hypothetical protein